MKTLFLTAIQSNIPDSSEGYIAGGIIALLILVYLIYTLVKPDKF